jgi:hypothetical protein
MKKCPYCGAEYPDEATVCAIDQTPFEEEAPQTSESFRRFLQSSAGLAITTGLAILLINTAVYCAIGRAYLTIRNHPDYVIPPPAHEIIGLSSFLRWVLMIAFVIFTFTICHIRCGKQWLGTLVAVIALGMTALLLFSPIILFLLVLPAFFIGFATDSSSGYYIGSALQIIVGAWLLGWLGRRKTTAITSS